MNGNRTTWNKQTMEWICCNRDAIKSIANELGVSPDAIAGIMAKENHAVVNRRLNLDYYLDLGICSIRDDTHKYWIAQFNKVASNPEASKLLYLAMHDIGPANIQIRTAILLLRDYVLHYPAHIPPVLEHDPLDLMQYAADYQKLVETLCGTDPLCGDERSRLTAALYGLMVKEAQDFFEKHADPYYYHVELLQRDRDALMVTYCCMGRERIQKKYNEAIANGEPYRPAPGSASTHAGGQNHLHNADRIREALDPRNCTWLAPAQAGIASYRQASYLCCIPDPSTKPEEAGPEITIDPLVLDLDGDGISTLSQENGVFFDFDANGFHELTGWIGAGSGLLMLDLNGNGELDDGSELFGDFTMMPTGENAGNGFHALSQYDDNMDGQIDANDAIWSQLGVYYDTEYYTPESAGGG